MSTSPDTEPGTPVWQVAELFPRQGEWSADDYLKLETNRLIELSDGSLEFLAMPTEWHQLLALYLYRRLAEHCDATAAGLAMAAPFRVQVAAGRFREPDVIFLSREQFSRRERLFWRGADLVMEVISEDDPDRDLVMKRAEYATAGIPEYWIVDPRDESVTVLTLHRDRGEYDSGRRYARGETVDSVRLDGFSVNLSELFAQPG